MERNNKSGANSPRNSDRKMSEFVIASESRTVITHGILKVLIQFIMITCMIFQMI